MAFKFEMNDEVTIKASGEYGLVIGQAHFANADDSFLIRYKAGDGRAQETWWTEDALLATD